MTTLDRRPETRSIAAGLAGFVLGLVGVFALAQALFGHDDEPGSRSTTLPRTPVSATISGDDPATGARVRSSSRPERRTTRAPEGTAAGGELPADSAAVLIGTLRERGLRVPVAGVAPDALRDHFLDPRGGGRTHFALDILADRNTPVLAVESGTVAHTDVDQPGGGIVVYQYGPSREFVYYYAHLERIADGLDAGDSVRPGQVIGYVGTTGNAPATVPHLHFAIHKTRPARRWWRGIPLNPFRVLR